MVSLFSHPASFRFHLTVDTLAFGYLLPAAGLFRRQFFEGRVEV